MADIFISYTSSDRDEAAWIFAELETLGHTPHMHEGEIVAGGSIYRWMEERHDAADHVLCVMSGAYLKADYSTLERDAALWQAASQRPGFVLIVPVKPCRLPTLADHYKRCQDLYDVPDAVARARFRAFMGVAARPKGKLRNQFAAVSNIPIRVPHHFMGRDAPLAAIAAALARYEGRVAVTALHGLRGVGKTTLAAAYAERHRADYRATWWIRAQTEPAMRADLVALGVRLGWAEPDAKEEPALAAVMERLRHEGEGILLIYDNAIDPASLKPYLPRGGAAGVLVTSNAPAWRGIAEPVEIRLWPSQVGADYLIARTGREAERAAAGSLSGTLGGLPLAHEQAAAYCERLKVGFAKYARRFAAAPVKFLDDARHAPADHNDGLTVAKSFALAIEEAAKLHPAAEPLILHAALLAPEPVPLYLFAEGREHFAEHLASGLGDDGLDEALAALEAFALIDRETIPDERDPAITTDTIRLHRLVREVAAARGSDETREGIRGALITAMTAVYPDGVFNDPATWPRARRLDALALGLVVPGLDIPPGREADASALLDRLAAYRQSSLAAYTGALPLARRALTIAEAALGEEHPTTAMSLNNLASLLHAQGDLDGARPLFERALAITEKVLGPGHPDTAASLNNLALLLHAQGDLAGARPLFERALAIKENVLGPGHPDTATSLNNLALLLQAQGDLAGARPLFERALAIQENVLGPGHPDTAASLNNLALLLQAQSDLDGARPLCERALAITEKVLGPGHPHTALSLNNLAGLVQAQGDLAGARPLYERALAIRENVLGPGHPETATSLNNLASLLHAQGDLDGARPLFERALASFQKALGINHPDTQQCGTNYARLLLDTEHAPEARALAEAALAVHAARLGPGHPWTKASARVTADALMALGEAEAAAEVRARYGLDV